MRKRTVNYHGVTIPVDEDVHDALLTQFARKHGFRKIPDPVDGTDALQRWRQAQLDFQAYVYAMHESGKNRKRTVVDYLRDSIVNRWRLR